MRNYNITKYKGNTHYSVNVTDSYGREKGGFFKTEGECHKFIYEIWDKEQPLSNKEIQQNLLNSAIHNCIRLDEKCGITPNLD